MSSVSGKKLLIIAVACGVLAGAMGWMYLKSKEAQYRDAYRPPVEAKVTVVVPRADIGKAQVDNLQSHIYRLEGGASARHAFRVASGLDSMVLGESQILGQFKDAVRVAADSGVLGTTLNQLFQRSFAVAIEVRTATDIGAHSIANRNYCGCAFISGLFGPGRNLVTTT